MWKIETITEPSKASVADAMNGLADGSSAAVRVPSMYTPDELTQVVENVKKTGVNWYPNFEFIQGRIGIGATEYAAKVNGKEAYFLLEAEASRTRDAIFPDTLDPVKKITDFFSYAFETAVAIEPSIEQRPYFTGLIRAMHKQSTTHFDYAPKQLPGWAVADADTQLSALIYLHTAGEGGSLEIYNRQWSESDEQHNKDVHEKGPRGFDGNFLDGVESSVLNPVEGELVVFNSRNFHRVTEMKTDIPRLSVNSFASMAAGRIALWN